MLLDKIENYQLSLKGEDSDDWTGKKKVSKKEREKEKNY